MALDYILLRKLAKNEYYQTIYNGGKDHHLKLFENETDFSLIQLAFFHYLAFYSSLFTDIYLCEVDKIVLENEIYEDAYIAYKNKKNKKELEQRTMKNYSSKRKGLVADKESYTKSQWKFRK